MHKAITPEFDIPTHFGNSVFHMYPSSGASITAEHLNVADPTNTLLLFLHRSRISSFGP